MNEIAELASGNFNIDEYVSNMIGMLRQSIQKTYVDKFIAILDEYKEPGSYVLTFDAGGLSSGTYFYQLQSGSFTDTKQMMAIK